MLLILCWQNAVVDIRLLHFGAVVLSSRARRQYYHNNNHNIIQQNKNSHHLIIFCCCLLLLIFYFYCCCCGAKKCPLQSRKRRINDNSANALGRFCWSSRFVLCFKPFRRLANMEWRQDERTNNIAYQKVSVNLPASLRRSCVGPLLRVRDLQHGFVAQLLRWG